MSETSGVPRGTPQGQAPAQLLISKCKDQCILWTSAEKSRVKLLLEFYSMDKEFCNILYTKKMDIPQDIKHICNICNCKPNQLIVYEDDERVIKKLKKLNITVVMKTAPDKL